MYNIIDYSVDNTLTVFLASQKQITLKSGTPPRNTTMTRLSCQVQDKQGYFCCIYPHVSKLSELGSNTAVGAGCKKNRRIASVTRHARRTYRIRRIRRIYLHYRIARIYTLDKRRQAKEKEQPTKD